MITGGQLGFSFWKIERRAVRFRVCGAKVDEESYDLKAAEDIPGKDAVRGLYIDDRPQAQRPGTQNYANQRKPQSKFITDHLRAGTQRAEQRILVIR